MTWFTLATTIIKFMPEFIELLKVLANGINNGVSEAKLKKDFKRISKALRIKDGKQAANNLDDIFRN